MGFGGSLLPPPPQQTTAAPTMDAAVHCGQWPLTMRAWCSAFRYCPDPLGIVTAQQLVKLEFGGSVRIFFFDLWVTLARLQQKAENTHIFCVQ